MREGISDVGLELRLLTQRPLSPDAGRGADAERKEMQGGGGHHSCDWAPATRIRVRNREGLVGAVQTHLLDRRTGEKIR